MKASSLIRLIAIVALGLTLLLRGTAWAASVAEVALYKAQDRQAKLEEGAKKEAEVVWYTSLSDSPRVVEAFEQRYPSVKVKATRLTTERVRRLADEVPLLHPGPFQRDVELDGAVIDAGRTEVWTQVRAGVAVRMATLAAIAETRGASGREAPARAGAGAGA